MVLPKIRYMGKLGMSANLMKLLKTSASTAIMSRGLSTDQTTPRALRRYFFLKSFETSMQSVNQLRRMAGVGNSFMGSFFPFDCISHNCANLHFTVLRNSGGRIQSTPTMRRPPRALRGHARANRSAP